MALGLTLLFEIFNANGTYILKVDSFIRELKKQCVTDRGVRGIWGAKTFLNAIKNTFKCRVKENHVVIIFLR